MKNYARRKPSILFYLRYPTEFWGNQQKWEPISRDEREGKIPLKFYRMDADTSIIDEPFADRIEFWENILKGNYQDGGQQ